jgi:hypoxanthine phosphoribosyltransferase
MPVRLSVRAFGWCRMTQRRELLTWDDIEQLLDHLIPQFRTDLDAMIMISRGGVIPGGMLAEALDIKVLLIAAVDFPFEVERQRSKLLAWPQFIQFPDDAQLRDRKILVTDDVWGSGRTITAVKNRVSAAGGFPSTCVLHFNPYRNLFNQTPPDYYAAITDAHIVYPWEVDRGVDNVLLEHPPAG